MPSPSPWLPPWIPLEASRGPAKVKELKLHDRRGKLEAERWNYGKVWVHFTGSGWCGCFGCFFLVNLFLMGLFGTLVWELDEF